VHTTIINKFRRRSNGEKLSFNDGMEKLRSQKRQNDPAWELKELELQVRKRTLDNIFGIKANV
jgi:hypothetical protein